MDALLKVATHFNRDAHVKGSFEADGFEMLSQCQAQQVTRPLIKRLISSQKTDSPQEGTTRGCDTDRKSRRLQLGVQAHTHNPSIQAYRLHPLKIYLRAALFTIHICIMNPRHNATPHMSSRTHLLHVWACYASVGVHPRITAFRLFSRVCKRTGCPIYNEA